jgi:hypothetical protein
MQTIAEISLALVANDGNLSQYSSSPLSSILLPLSQTNLRVSCLTKTQREVSAQVQRRTSRASHSNTTQLRNGDEVSQQNKTQQKRRYVVRGKERDETNGGCYYINPSPLSAIGISSSSHPIQKIYRE